METIKQAISFGELLKTYRKRQGLTQQQLARKLDTHKNTIGAWERGDYLPVTRGMILELSQCLQLSDTEEHSLLEASLFTVTSRWSVPFQRNTLFTGRQATLQQIHQALSENPYAISSRSCALRGMAGVGKTQAAIEYAYRYARDYTAVFWIQANSEEDMLGCIAAIARILKLPTYGVSKREEVMTLLLDWLQIHRNWLLIFDNIEENTFIQPFLSVARNGFFLMTTRLPTLGTLASCLELLPLPLEESIQLLLRRARMLPPPLPISEEETRALQAIALAMDGLPLALDQAAAYIEESQCSFSEFSALLQSNLLLVLRERPFSVNYPRSVEQTFTQAFERLRQQNQLAADLLLFCSFLAPDEIPEVLLNQMMSQLPDKFQADLSQPFRLSTAIKDLLGSALIRRNTHTKTLVVHCLVQTVLREQLPEAIQRIWIERLLHLLDQHFLVEHRRWCGQLAPHAQMVLQLADSLKITSAPASSLLLKTAAFLFEQTPSEQTEHLSIYSLAIQERANA
ncbi:MAG TPA: helix-turn-helix transcriptional regulator, partial [Ktedonobacteraceae bacterium]|nr:helix-turn-helix transcriptional regulator [Ktedonobacteraceae bacterium]